MRKTSSFRWVYPSTKDSDIACELAKAWNTNKVIAMLMHRRQLHSKDVLKAFFKPNLKDLHDPFTMKDMDVAVNRLKKAIKSQERIVFFGDYDVDGTTSVALMKSFFSSRYHDFYTYIPDRYNEGYGLSKQGIDWAINKGCRLMITLDCGIKSVSLVKYAQENGLDIIICDHHTPGETLPPAIAVLDPKRSDCRYPFKELSGCGVGFKLLCAYAKDQDIDINEVFAHLDLLALSIGADIVPIVGENRILAHYGMQRIRLSPCMGIAALTKVAKRHIRTIDDVVFTIAPRINAAGRMAHGSEAVELLSTNDIETANTLARQLDALNQQRRSTDQNITKEAVDIIASRLDPDAASTVVYNEDWHKGVIGIVASRLVERFYRPTIVLTKSNGVYAGSARSVEGFDLYQALEKCENELIQFGGHMYAAGMTVKANNIEQFADRFESVVSEQITPEQKIPQLNIDAILPFSFIDDTLTNTLTQMQPFGPQNMKPVFVTRNLILGDDTRTVGSDNSHLKIEVIDPQTGESRMGIAFGWGEKMEALKNAEHLHLAYHLDENVWNGKSLWQLHVLDIDY